MNTIKRVSWSVVAGLALLVACSAPEGRAPLSPTSAGGPDAVGVESSLSASAMSCTLTQGYWKNHPDSWPVDEITIGGVTYSVEEAIGILMTPTKGDATYILAHQLIAAILNGGADDAAVEVVVLAADTWLADNPLGFPPKGDTRQTGIEYAETLDAFNNGLIGPGHCADDQTPEPIPSPSPDPTAGT